MQNSRKKRHYNNSRRGCCCGTCQKEWRVEATKGHGYQGIVKKPGLVWHNFLIGFNFGFDWDIFWQLGDSFRLPFGIGQFCVSFLFVAAPSERNGCKLWWAKNASALRGNATPTCLSRKSRIFLTFSNPGPRESKKRYFTWLVRMMGMPRMPNEKHIYFWVGPCADHALKLCWDFHHTEWTRLEALTCATRMQKHLANLLTWLPASMRSWWSFTIQWQSHCRQSS